MITINHADGTVYRVDRRNGFNRYFVYSICKAARYEGHFVHHVAVTAMSETEAVDKARADYANYILKEKANENR